MSSGQLRKEYIAYLCSGRSFVISLGIVEKIDNCFLDLITISLMHLNNTFTYLY